MRYDFAPLEHWVHRHYEVNGQGHLGVVHLLSMADHQAYYRGQQDGSFTERTAERVAMAFGEMPETIWPEWSSEPVPELCHWCHRHLTKSHTPLQKACARDYDAFRLGIREKRIARITARVSVMTDTRLDAFLGIEHCEMAVAA